MSQVRRGRGPRIVPETEPPQRSMLGKSESRC